jgi:hypothetical protein
VRPGTEPRRLDDVPHRGEHGRLTAHHVHVRRHDMRHVAAHGVQLLCEVGQHLPGLAHRIALADELSVGVERHGTGEEREPGPRLHDGRVGVAGRREQGGNGDALGDARRCGPWSTGRGTSMGSVLIRSSTSSCRRRTAARTASERRTEASDAVRNSSLRSAAATRSARSSRACGAPRNGSRAASRSGAPSSRRTIPSLHPRARSSACDTHRCPSASSALLLSASRYSP